MSAKRSACFLCLCSPLVSLLRNIGIQPAPNHQVFPSENVPGGKDGDRGGNEHSLAFIFSQKNARQMVAQRFLPFSLIAPHPGCLGKQCSSTHICNEISKAAVLLLPPIYCGCPCLRFMGGLSSRVLLCLLQISCLPLDRRYWVAASVCYLVQIPSARATGQEIPSQPLITRCCLAQSPWLGVIINPRYLVTL